MSALIFFDEDGRPVYTSLQSLLIGITLEDMKNIDTVVCVAGGSEKVQAIKGALKGGFIDVLITDFHTANQLIIND